MFGCFQAQHLKLLVTKLQGLHQLLHCQQFDAQV
jgi:hypothetical protein